MKKLDGSSISNNDGYGVGFCEMCRHSQTTLYYFKELQYCIDCFTKKVNMETALLNYKQTLGDT